MRFSTILILFLAFSQISLNVCGALMKGELMRKKSRKSSKSSKKTKKSKSSLSTSIPPSKNKWYQLFVGMLAGLANLSDSDVANLNKCVPSAWQAVDTSAGANDSPAGQSKSTWTTILDGLEKIINIVCKFKDQIKKMLVGRIRRQVKRYQYKMLLQKSMNRYKKAVGWFDSIKNGVAGVANAAWNAVKGTAENFVKNARVFIDAVRQKVTAFLNSDFVAKIKLFYECVQNAKSAAKNVIDAIKRLFELVKKISLIVGGDMVTLGKLIVDLICNFSLFRKAFTYLADSFSTNETVKKYSLIGKFIGTFLNAVAVRRNKKHKH